jgi:hypothetical protein
MEWWPCCLGGSLIVGVAILWRYVRRKRLSREQKAERAQQEGATHIAVFGPNVVFYRTRDDKVEYCYAEYSPTANRLVWESEPLKWRECDEIPERAKPI